MKKNLTALVLCGLFGIFFHEKVNAKNGQKRTFTITGYYSPLPNQDFYITGDLLSEMRLNGEGEFGADKTPVYPGMIAAPKSYAFGTKICIPKFGCGAVHDRGGAIVEQGKRNLAKFDRLDLWMGYGDEGLRRALAWGVQHLECEMYDASAPVLESVNFDVPLAISQIVHLPAKQKFSIDLYPGIKNIEETKRVQIVLKNLGFYKGEINGVYNYLMEKAVMQFQKKHFIIQKNTDIGAGRLGPITREKLTHVVYSYEIQKRIQQMWEKFHFDQELSRGHRNQDVLRLQELLVKEELLLVNPTGFFGLKTEAALKKFQIKYGIIQNEKTAGAGKVGPKTRDKLNEILVQRKQNNLKEKSQILAYQKSRQKLKYIASKNIKNIPILAYGKSGNFVKELQTILQTLGYLEAEPNGYFGFNTKKAVTNFQLEHGIINSAKQKGSGTFGPNTQKTLLESLKI